MKFLTLILASLTFAAATAVAQPAIDDEKKAAVRELLVAMDFKRTLTQMTRQMSAQLPQMMEKMSADMMRGVEIPSSEQEKMRARTKKFVEGIGQRAVSIYEDPEVVAGMEDIMARAFGQNFATDEIRAISAFYTTPAGKKLLETQPAIMQQTMPEIMALIAPRMKAVTDAAMKEMRSEIESLTSKK